MHPFRITTPADLADAQALRVAVFVHEQHVPADLELDEYEGICQHYLLRDAQGQAIATARWRITPAGKAKLERVAVAAHARGTGAGRAIVQAALADIPRDRPTYIHAQVSALPFWQRMGFVAQGARFDEAGIEHVTMVWQPGT